MYMFVILVMFNGSPYMSGSKVNLTEEQCITLGEKMEKDVPLVTNGKGVAIWKCINGTEKTL